MTSHSIEGLSDGGLREEIARIFDDARGEFDGYPYDNGGGACGWNDACSALKERVLLALSAAPERVEGGGWEPIDSAPRDGTPILAFCVHPNARLAGEDCAEWTEIVTTRWIDFNGGGWTWNGICGVHTHWQPLPSPPIGAEGGRDGLAGDSGCGEGTQEPSPSGAQRSDGRGEA